MTTKPPRDIAAYPFRTHTETRFQDLDPLGHLNNVAIAALFENGRVRFNQSLGLTHAPGTRWLIARVEIDYVAEGFFPEAVEIASGIGRVGNSSWQIVSAAFQEKGCVATSVTTLVLTNKDGSLPMDDAMRAVLAANMVEGSAEG
ncbi:acyl-CoA thioesterase [Novosphingopyxis sp.]|uniref:acyl-CoA thioesterase n=1 Tax=Novosphingopyxis sp. TaxID=2709690 RepID=UPI003B5CACF9